MAKSKAQRADTGDSWSIQASPYICGVCRAPAVSVEAVQQHIRDAHPASDYVIPRDPKADSDDKDDGLLATVVAVVEERNAARTEAQAYAKRTATAERRAARDAPIARRARQLKAKRDAARREQAKRDQEQQDAKFTAKVWPELRAKYGQRGWRLDALDLCKKQNLSMSERTLDRVLDRLRIKGVVPPLRSPPHRFTTRR